MRAARVALHVEKAKDGLVAVTLAPRSASAGSDDATIAAESAATPAVTVADE